MTTETHSFQAEVSRLLEMVAHSLYSEREVFLRELVSNASDALDRLRYESLTTPALIGNDSELKISLIINKANRTLTIADNGIGMNREDLISNLGTIARSGTSEFLKQAADGGKPSLIGQFGVGFYAAFMVADEVVVTSRKAGDSEGWQWTSDGKGSFAIESCASAPARGTTICLKLKEGADEYLDESRLGDIIKRYSDHIAFPIVVPGEQADMQRTLNSASALWLRQPRDITPEQYKEFYHHNSHAFDDPWQTLHWHAEGTLDYRALLFIPSTKPFDLFDPQRRHHVKLYVRRVFITDAADGLLPPYLRFVRGVVDSEDLPLNVSREMLQNNPVLDKMRAGLSKRILGDLAKFARDNAEYSTFWENFGSVLKEGIYEDKDHQTLLLKLCRFQTTRTVAEDGKPVDLDTYISRMKEGQDTIFTISGTDVAALANSPQLEGFKARGIEVLLLTDAVDDFWQPAVEAYEGRKFKSVTRSGVDLSKFEPIEKNDEDKAQAATDMAEVIAAMKAALGDMVGDIKVSQRLTESPVCLVAGENDIDLNLERLLRAHKQMPQGVKRTLEINPRHVLIRQLEAMVKAKDNSDIINLSWVLLDQARILEGEPLPDPVGFANRMTSLLAKGLGKVA